MEKKKQCPKCGAIEKQRRMGFNASGTQRYVCGLCKKTYTPNPKPWGYSDEIKELAIKEFYSGASALGVAKIHGFNKSNVLNWIKKNN